MTAPDPIDDDQEITRALAALAGEDIEEPLTPDLVAPSGLSPNGAALWMSIASNYTLRPDDEIVLDMAAKVQTTLDAVEAKWAEEGFPMVGQGYAGQEVEHPLLTMADKQRKTLAQLLRQLRLPDDDSGVSPFSHAGRGSAGGRRTAARTNKGEFARATHRGRNKPGPVTGG